MRKLIYILIIISSTKLFSQNNFLDPSFGTNGKVITGLFINGDNHGTCLAVQNDDKSVVAGYTYNGTDYDFAIVRYKVNGSLDSTFGTNGKVITNIAGNDKIYAIVLQNDGKIVVGGVSSENRNNSPGTADFALARYNIDGSLDLNFGIGGIVTTNFTVDHFGVTSVEQISSITLQTDGKILASGYYSYGGSQAVIARYNPSGILDATFGINGKFSVSNSIVSTSYKSPYPSVPMALQPNGKIIVGTTQFNSSTGQKYGNIFRINSNGTLDASLATLSYTFPEKIIIDANQKILICGNSDNWGQQIGIARLDSNGSYDFSLVPFGYTHLDINGSATYGNSCIIQNDGKILITGYKSSNNDTLILVRTNSDGTLDNAFGKGGVITTYFSRTNSKGYGVAIQNDGRIVTAGETSSSIVSDFSVARYLDCSNLPVANAGADKPVCMGSSVQIGSTPLANYIYSWSPTTGLSNPNIANPLASPLSNTTYVLTVTSPSGCSATDDVVVTVVAAPVANAGANQSICAGNGVQIGAPTVAGNTYSWTPTTGLSNPNISNPITSNIYTQTYTLTVTNTLNCTATDQVTVTIKPLPNTTLTVSPSNTICRGDAVTLTASGATTYVWSPSGSGTSQVITPSDVITYSITGTTNGCDKSASQTISVKPIPATPNISQSHDTLYSNVSITGASYKWYKNGILVSTTTNPYIKITSTGSYTVQVVSNGCSATSAVFVVSSVAAIKNTTSAINKFEIYPNPASQNLNINIQSNKNTTIQLRIFDVNGNEMIADEIKITKGETMQKIDVSNFAKGMYVIQLTDEDGIATDKFVVE